MKTYFLLCLLPMILTHLPFEADGQNAIAYKSVRLDAETTERLRGLQDKFLRIDSKGNCTVNSSYEIIEDKKLKEIVFQPKELEITSYNGKKKFHGITIVCAGCSKGCKPTINITDGGSTLTFGCTPCKENTLTGCMASVKVPVNKVLDRERADGGR